MKRGCTIDIFLPDGDPSSICKYSAKNRTILAYKVPRTKLDAAKNIPALKQTGVYFLFGTNDSTNTPLVYVGQAVLRQNGEGLLNRLNERNRQTSHRLAPKKRQYKIVTDSIGIVTETLSQ